MKLSQNRYYNPKVMEVKSDQKFNLIKAEIGLIFIDAKKFNLAKQLMDDNQSYRVKIEPLAEKKARRKK